MRKKKKPELWLANDGESNMKWVILFIEKPTWNERLQQWVGREIDSFCIVGFKKALSLTKDTFPTDGKPWACKISLNLEILSDALSPEEVR